MKVTANMKKITLLCFFLSSLFIFNVYAQDNNTKSKRSAAKEEKRERRKNQVVKEWNTDAKGKRKWMDHMTVWDENGLKLEDVEYAVYGQKERTTYEYDDTGKCIRENVYNDKNKLYRVRKYEYNEDGRKKIQYNYAPDGKLFSTKVFEYSSTDAETN